MEGLHKHSYFVLLSYQFIMQYVDISRSSSNHYPYILTKHFIFNSFSLWNVLLPICSLFSLKYGYLRNQQDINNAAHTSDYSVCSK